MFGFLKGKLKSALSIFSKKVDEEGEDVNAEAVESLPELLPEKKEVLNEEKKVEKKEEKKEIKKEEKKEKKVLPVEIQKKEQIVDFVVEPEKKGFFASLNYQP